MLSKQDFLDLAFSNIGDYPILEILYRVRHPRLMQNIEAIAAMLSAISSQIEVAQAEPFEKVRDATVIADAALKGILRRGRSARISVLVDNQNPATPITIAAGRVIFDTKGNPYRVETPVTIAASSTATIECTQVRSESITHTVSGSIPFYAIEIPESDDGSYVSGIEVSDPAGVYQYRQRYVNIGVDDRVFHVEADDRQRMYVRFGQSGVVGYQPPDGTVITLTIFRCQGKIELGVNSPFAFEYALSPTDSRVNMRLNAVLDSGENPIDIDVLRDLSRYPTVYDHNAVYLGEFYFMVRQNYPTVQFLSVWNENREEQARGADVNNINVLFVSVMSSVGIESVLDEPNPLSPVSPAVISSLTPTQAGIKSLILGADDSYKVRFYTPVKSKITMSVTATVSTAYSASDVESSIRALILDNYGQSSKLARRGALVINNQEAYRLLRTGIPALADPGADIDIEITPYPGVMRPELWRYVDASTLNVVVNRANIVINGWR